jgi:Putative lumazine-binding
MVQSVDSDTDRRAIEAVVADYFQGWYEGDADRMDRALHPRLAKRAPMGALQAFGLVPEGDPDGLDENTRQSMVEATERGVVLTRAPTPEDRRIDVEINDIYDWIASVTIRSSIYHEYLHLARTPSGWKIVNALWQRTNSEGGDVAG